jgi:hypothetical protein
MCRINRELASIDSSQIAVNQFADFLGSGPVESANACGSGDTIECLASPIPAGGSMRKIAFPAIKAG